MKLKILAAAAAVGMALSGGAGADTVTLYEFSSDTNLWFDDSTDQHKVSIAYDSTLWQSITSATLSIKLLDDGDTPTEKGRLGTFSTLVDVTGDYYGAYDVASLLTTGGPRSLDISFFTRQNGDFWYKNAKLDVTFVAVPEASELLLMGAGLVAVGAFARKRRAAAHWV